MRRSMIRAAAAAVLLSLTTLARADVLHVNANLESGADDGSSWENAYRGTLGLQTAFGAAVAGDEIWVAAGTYLPADGSPRTATFALRSGIAVYGGFAGGETSVDERDVASNEVILSGDLAQNDPTTSDNAFHVVTGNAADGTALLSGVTITAGFANGSGNNNRGAGLSVVGGGTPRIEDCIVRGNRCTFGGGAGYIANAGPRFARVTFESNIGGSFGGAFDIFASGGVSQVRFDDCRFIGNSAARAGGVEVFGSGAIATMSNCLFYDNATSGLGGAVWTGSSGRARMFNCTVVANDAGGNTGGLHLSGSQSTVRNTIVWFNTDDDASSQIFGSAQVEFSNVQGGWSGPGGDNIDAEPIFEDLPAGDLRLGAGSPGIDAGRNGFVTSGAETDLDGGPRFLDDPLVDDTGVGDAPIVDMGAYERGVTCAGDSNRNGIVAFNDLLRVLYAWGPCPGCNEDHDGDDEVGNEDLLITLAAWGPCE